MDRIQGGYKLYPPWILTVYNHMILIPKAQRVGTNCTYPSNVRKNRTFESQNYNFLEFLIGHAVDAAAHAAQEIEGNVYYDHFVALGFQLGL